MPICPLGRWSGTGPRRPSGWTRSSRRRAPCAARAPSAASCSPRSTPAPSASAIPETLAHLGFADTAQYIVGMDFPDNSTPSYYFREEIFALTVREYLRLLVKQGYKLVVLVNGHGATGQMSSLSRLAAEFTGETDTRVLVGFPAASLASPARTPGHATRAEISQAMALTDSVGPDQAPARGRADLHVEDPAWRTAAPSPATRARTSPSRTTRARATGTWASATLAAGRGGAHRAGARGLGAGLRGLTAEHFAPFRRVGRWGRRQRAPALCFAAENSAPPGGTHAKEQADLRPARIADTSPPSGWAAARPAARGTKWRSRPRPRPRRPPALRARARC